MKRIAIIGGGIAGLTAAWQLTRPGYQIEVALFEASSRLGGIVETVREQGFTIECGPDAWVTGKPWARQLAEELGLAADLLPSNDATRKTYILRDGTLVAMPDGMRMMVPADLAAVDASPLFSPAAKQAFHDEQARAAELKASAPHEDESVASFVRRHFGNEVLATVGAPLLSGVFGGDVSTLSVQAVMAPFVAMEREHGSLITAVQTNRAATESLFTTLRNGLGTLIDAMAANLPAAAVRLNTPVTALTRTSTGWTVCTHENKEHFDAVLLATPIPIAADLLRPTDPRAADLMQLDASSAIIVAFGIPAAPSGLPAITDLPPGFGFLIPPPQPGTHTKIPPGDTLLAVTFADQKFAGRAPQGGRLLRAFFGGQSLGQPGARLLTADDATITTLARTQLELILKIGPLPEPAVTVVRRWPRSLPQYAVGHLTRIAELDRRIKALGNLQLLGNGYRGVGLPDLIRDARDAARHLL